MKINLKATRLGRVLRRLSGDQEGAVMMEYVVLVSLLVAGVVAAAIYFGRTASTGMTAGAQAMSGQVTEAEKTAGENQKSQSDYKTKSQKSQKAM